MTLQNLLEIDPTILDCCELVPEQITPLILKNEIVMQCGLLTPVYSEPDVFKELAMQFFKARSWEFEHLVNIIEAQYSPIDNVSEERIEERDITRKNDRTDSRSIDRDVTEDTNRNGKETREESTESTSDTNGMTENTISAFDSNQYQPDNKSVSESDANAYLNTEAETTKNDTEKRILNDDTIDKLVGSTDEKTKDTFTVKRHGNIGVTTNFDLIKGELSLLNEFNLYKWIALQFRSALMIEIF